MISRLFLLLLFKLVVSLENKTDTNDQEDFKETLNFGGSPAVNPTHKHYHPDGSSEIPLIIPDTWDKFNVPSNQIVNNGTSFKKEIIVKNNFNESVLEPLNPNSIFKPQVNSTLFDTNSPVTLQASPQNSQNRSFDDKFNSNISSLSHFSNNNVQTIFNSDNVIHQNVKSEAVNDSLIINNSSDVKPSLTNNVVKTSEFKNNNSFTELPSLDDSLINITQLNMNKSDMLNVINESLSKSMLANLPTSLIMQRAGRIIDPNNLTAEDFKAILNYLKDNGLPNESSAQISKNLNPAPVWKPLSTFSLTGNSNSNSQTNNLSSQPNPLLLTSSENHNNQLLSEGRANSNTTKSVDTQITELQNLRNKLKELGNSDKPKPLVNIPLSPTSPILNAGNSPNINSPDLISSLLNFSAPSSSALAPSNQNSAISNILPPLSPSSNLLPIPPEMNFSSPKLNISSDLPKIPPAIKLPADKNSASNSLNVIASSTASKPQNNLTNVNLKPLSLPLNLPASKPQITSNTTVLNPSSSNSPSNLQPNSAIANALLKPQATIINNNISEPIKPKENITGSSASTPPAMFLPNRQGEDAASLAQAISQTSTNGGNDAASLAQAISSNSPPDATLSANLPSLGTLLSAGGASSSDVSGSISVSQDVSDIQATLLSSAAPPAIQVSSGSPANTPGSNSPSISLPQTGDSPPIRDTVDSAIPQISGIDVLCGNEGMKVTTNFTQPFKGKIYSKDHYNEPECIYVNGDQNQLSYVFEVKMAMCGTLSGRTDEGTSYFQNTLMFQNDQEYVDAFDSSKTIRCDWKGSLNNTLVFVPLSVDVLEIQTLVFNGDKVVTKLEILIGSGPFGAPVGPQIINIGDPLSLVISIQSANDVNVIIHDCYAYKSPQSTSPPLLLIDSNGCSVKRKLISSFTTTKIPGTFSSSIIAYATFRAFKFPDALEVYFLCQLTVCRDNCVSPCSQSALGSPPAVPQTTVPPVATAAPVTGSAAPPATTAGPVAATSLPGAAAATIAATALSTSDGQNAASNLAGLISQSGSARSLAEIIPNAQSVQNSKENVPNSLTGESREIEPNSHNVLGINQNNIGQENGVSVNDFNRLKPNQKPHEGLYLDNLAKAIQRNFSPAEINQMIKYYQHQRKKRSPESVTGNRTMISLLNKIKVVAPTDIYEIEGPTYKHRQNLYFVCIPKSSFIIGTAFLLLLAFMTSLTTLFFCIHYNYYQKVNRKRTLSNKVVI